MTEMGTVTVVRNAAVMVAIVPLAVEAVVALVFDIGAGLPLASLLFLDLLRPPLLLFLLPLLRLTCCDRPFFCCFLSCFCCCLCSDWPWALAGIFIPTNHAALRTAAPTIRFKILIFTVHLTW